MASKWAAVVLLLALVACSEPQDGAIPAAGPNDGFTALPLLDSDPIQLEALGERVLLINYWAVWCAPCIEEMPELAEFRARHGDLAELVGYNYDAPALERLRADVLELDVRIPVLTEDPAPLFGLPPVEALPVTWVIVDGEAREALLGPQDIESLLNALARWKENRE